MPINNQLDNVSWRKAMIFCFSGTGNSLIAAKWIAESFGKNGIESKILPIDRKKKVEDSELETNCIIGFHYPTHGFNLPWYMLKFIWRFPKAKNNIKDFYLLNTRAGAKVSKLFTPGVSGIALLLPMIILLTKGYRVKGILPLDPPSNWVSLHPGFRQKVVNSIIERCKRITERFADKLLEGKTVIHPSSYLSLPIDIALIPISLGYLVVGRYFLAKTFYASSTCNGCGICESHCPVNAIKMKDSRPYWRFRCESCMRCMNICPQKSINTIHLYAVLVIWIATNIPISRITTDWILSISPEWLVYIDGLISLTVLTIFSLPLLWLSYHLVYFTSRYRIVNWIFTHTSLTRYWRRYIAPGVKASSFGK